MNSTELHEFIKKFRNLPKINKLVLVIRPNGQTITGKIKVIQSTADSSLMLFKLGEGIELIFSDNKWLLSLGGVSSGSVEVKWGTEIMGL